MILTFKNYLLTKGINTSYELMAIMGFRGKVPTNLAWGMGEAENGDWEILHIYGNLVS